MEKSIFLSYSRVELELICENFLRTVPKVAHIKIIGLCLCLCLLGLFLVFHDDKNIIVFLALSTFPIFGIYYFIKDLLRFRREKRYTIHFLNDRDDMQIFKLTYDKEKIIQFGHYHTFEVIWKNAKQIATADNYIYARESDEKIIVIPASFMEVEEFEELKNFLEDIDRQLSEGTL